MEIGVIIPVADDIRLKDCLASIDEDVEVVISLNGTTSAVRKIAEDSGKVCCEISERNLGAALDEGIKTAKSARVILMDSDCTFNPGTIRLLFNGLDDYKLAKGRVLFKSVDYTSRVIAKAREYTTSDVVNAYNPPLALRKNILGDVGGYFYDRDIHWVEDSDFDNRVKKFGVKINYLPNATINHPPLSLFSDLRSGFRYGIGKRIGVEKGLLNGIGNFMCNESDIWKKKGFDTATYMFFWNFSYTFGYFSQAMFDIYRIKRKLRTEVRA